ncbi:hypothetical protein CISIN_1g032569mg [Citrus sinensis]|uniref:Protein kinase domain-containing protein n=4 Tax=Citrus TaxID=2706 RepID=A0A067DQ37_CITSI|nr:hypothetical protein CISIN_1g032569mg [Citrus sinensis]
MRTVTTKVDVFSFGIVVMEFLTKRRPTGLDEENGLSPISLRQLVEKALANGINGVRQITDPKLVLSIYEEQEQHQVLEELFKLALVCTSSNPEDRPNMNEVLSMLQKLRETRFGNRDEHFPFDEGESNTTAPLKEQFY